MRRGEKQDAEESRIIQECGNGPEIHGDDQSLVAIAQVDAAPDRGSVHMVFVHPVHAFCRRHPVIRLVFFFVLHEIFSFPQTTGRTCCFRRRLKQKTFACKRRRYKLLPRYHSYLDPAITGSHSIRFCSGVRRHHRPMLPSHRPAALCDIRKRWFIPVIAIFDLFAIIVCSARCVKTGFVKNQNCRWRRC